MKNIILAILLIISSFSFSQEINQFDGNGKRHGIWSKSFEGTKAIRYEGQFNHGKEVGLFKFYKYIDKKSVLSATKQFNETNNLVDVKFLTTKGKVISEGQMDGKKHIGNWNYYHKNSKQLLRVEHYDNYGLQQGELLVYFKNGILAEKSNYKSGQIDGESLWYSEVGVVIKQLNYRLGELHGLAKHYTNSGVLIAEGNYRNNKKHGVWKYYQNEKLIKEKNFTRRSKNPYKKQ